MLRELQIKMKIFSVEPVLAIHSKWVQLVLCMCVVFFKLLKFVCIISVS